MKKNKLKAIIIALIIISVIMIVILSLYLFTDLFRSKKQIFFEAMSQNKKTFQLFEDESLQSYLAKQQKTPYTSKGELTGKIQDSSGKIIDETITGQLNQFKIVIDGKTDNVNQKQEENVTIQYSDDVKFPFSYKKSGDSYGLKSDLVVNKYVIIKNENVKELATLLGVEDTSTFPNYINFASSLSFTKEEQEQLQKNYVTLLNTILSNDQIKKESAENGQTMYQLNLTQRETQQVGIKLLENMKQDGILIGKLSAYITSEQWQKQIDNVINGLNQLPVNDDPYLKINVYLQGKTLTKTEIVIQNQITTLEVSDSKVNLEKQGDIGFKFSIEKQEASDKLQYNVIYTTLAKGKEETKISFNYLFDGIQSTDTGKEAAQLKVESLLQTDKTAQSSQTGELKEKEVILKLQEELAISAQTGQTDQYTVLKQIIQNAYKETLSIDKITDEQYKLTFLKSNHFYVIDAGANILENETEEQNQMSGEEQNATAQKITSLYTYQNEKKFVEQTQIEELNEENSKALNGSSQEYVQNLLQAIFERIDLVNKQQMQTLGYTTNPLTYFLSGITGQIAIDQNQNSDEIVQEDAALSTNQNQEGQITGQTDAELAEWAKYEGDVINGVQIKELLVKIKQYNANMEEEAAYIQLQINQIDIPDKTIESVISQVMDEKTYQVKIEKDVSTKKIKQIYIVINNS